MYILSITTLLLRMYIHSHSDISAIMISIIKLNKTCMYIYRNMCICHHVIGYNMLKTVFVGLSRASPKNFLHNLSRLRCTMCVPVIVKGSFVRNAAHSTPSIITYFIFEICHSQFPISISLPL